MSGADLQAKLQTAVNAMMEKIEKERMRPLQRAAHLQISNCYDNKHGSTEEVEACANSHFTPFKRIQAVIQHEMNVFQDRISRCSMDCQDAVKDKYGNSQDEAGANKMMYSCMSTCVDKHVALLKSVQVNLEQQIDQLSKGHK